MTNTYNPKLKQYHIILLSCLLSPLLIFNSNYVNKQRAEAKLNKEKSILFNKIISRRYLQEEAQENSSSNSDEVCGRGSPELVSYYETGDLNKIDLDDKPIKSDQRGKAYFDALINIIKSVTGGNDEDDGNDSSPEHSNGEQDGENSGNDETGEDENGGGRNLVEISEIKDDLITYVKHILPIIIFLAIGILSIPGWIVCCFCNCCNCCCCCCCKKPGCKIPCFIFTYVFYALSVIICIYGLSQTNKAFKGIADTECSILKFFDQVLEGETKKDTPRWAGIQGINNILENLHNTIEGMQGHTYNELTTQINQIKEKEDEFLNLMKGSSKLFLNSNPTSSKDYQNQYITTTNYNKDFGGYKANGQYVLDFVNKIGSYDENQKKFVPENSTLSSWELEYSTIAGIANDYIETARSGFEEVLDNSSGEILNSLNTGKNTLEDLRGSFDDVQSSVASPIADYSDLIDKYGKLGSKLVFGVLGLMNVALAVLVFLICFCSGEMCVNCCCCRCIFKFFTHLLWNILALLMIVTFLVGFLFSFVGTIGEDVMNVISFVVSEENLGRNGTGGEGILVGKLGDAKSYLDRCVNGDGKIEKEIGLNENQIGSFSNISDSQSRIEETHEQFEVLKSNFITYNLYKTLMELSINLTNPQLTLIPKDQSFKDEDQSKFLKFVNVLLDMNTEIKTNADTDAHKGESWVVTDYNENQVCDSSNPNNVYTNPKFSPLKCNPILRGWISSSGNQNINIRAQIISDFIDQVNKVKNPYLNQLESLKTSYETYLTSYINALDKFNDTIGSITETMNEYVGDTDIFGFIKCNFIGTNLKIMLKYLKSALGKSIKTIGICVTVVGCSLALSISSTILLIVIINKDIDEKKKKLQAQKIPEYPVNSEGRLVQYQ